MERILNAAQMRQADEDTIAGGMPSLVLMERAALAVADELERTGWDTSRILAVCGTGNNGGDGVAAARLLAERGYSVSVCLTGNREKYSEQMRCQLKIAEKYPITFVNSFDPGEYTVIIDALFGVGLAREVGGVFLDAVRAVNRSGAKILSVDIPSGVHTDTGQILGEAVKADLTVTVAYKKQGLLLFPGAGCAGGVILKKIGIRAAEAVPAESVYCLEEKDIQSLPVRDESGNKGTFQKLLIIAGSETICGAAFLSAKAALRTGVGMVRIYTAEKNRTPLSVLIPEALIDTWEGEEPDGGQLQSLLDWADAVESGPGLSVSGFAEKLLALFLEMNHLPCVMDADALNLMARNPGLWEKVKFPCTITPHVGEMSRLTGLSAAVIKSDLVAAARNFAMEHGVVCHLKDARSVTASENGCCYITVTGNSALATAGSGDVLAGIIAGLTVQEDRLPAPAAAVGACIHGLCGREASRKYSRASAAAADLLDEIAGFL